MTDLSMQVIPRLIVGDTLQLGVQRNTSEFTHINFPNLDFNKAFGVAFTNDVGYDINGYHPDHFYVGYPGSSPHAKSMLIPDSNDRGGPTGPDIYKMNSPKTVMLRITWKMINTALNTYDWRLFDTMFDRAISANKRVIFSCWAGKETPDWVESDPTHPVPLYTFRFVPSGSPPAKATSFKAPDPRNRNFLFHWGNFIKAVAEHCKAKSYDQYVDQVKIEGINVVTEEIRLPSGTGIAVALDGSTETNDLAFWSTVGYTPNSMVVAWKTIVRFYNAAWSTTQLAMAIVINGGWPNYGGSGSTIAPNLTGVNGYASQNPGIDGMSSTAQIDTLVKSARIILGDRLAVNWNALKRTTSSPNQLLTSYAELGIKVGYQVDASEMTNPQCPIITGTPKNGPPYGNLTTPSHGGLADCDPTLIYNYGDEVLPGSIDVGLRSGSGSTGYGLEWLETMQNSVIAYNVNMMDGDAAMRARDDHIRWISSDTTIAKVDPAGLVIGVSEGTVVISAYHPASDTTLDMPLTVSV